MTIQASIIEALKASQSAHVAGLGEVKALRDQKAGLEQRVATLEARVAALEAESVKIVDPDTVQPLLEELARAVAATHAAVTPASPSPSMIAQPAPMPEPAPVATPEEEVHADEPVSHLEAANAA